MQYARSTRMFYYIWLDFAVWKPACFPGHSDPQSSAQWKVCHIRHVVSDIHNTETDNSWLTASQAPQWQMTAHLNVSTIYVFRLLCTINMLYILLLLRTKWIRVQMVSYIWVIFTLEWLWKHSCSTCTPNLPTKAVTDPKASESKFKAHYHGGGEFNFEESL